ncbi:DUF4397 domain-containing protein [candidate division GN15 bacterium]|nr:DUF4397 domain-containing protein [candidate division GN15 bacterium]
MRIAMRGILKRTLPFMLTAIMVVVLACDDDDNGLQPTDETLIMLVNGSPDAGGLSLLIDTAEVATNIDFQEYSPYREVPAGQQDISVELSPTQASIVDTSVMLDDNAFYSAYTADTIETASILVLRDDINEPDTNEVFVRLVHLAPGLGSIDVSFPGVDTVFAAMSNVDYMGNSSFQEVEAGSYVLQVRPTGTAQDLLTTPTIEFFEGRNYTVILTGYDGGTGEQALQLDTVVNQLPGVQP